MYEGKILGGYIEREKSAFGFITMFLVFYIAWFVFIVFNPINNEDDINVFNAMLVIALFGLIFLPLIIYSLLRQLSESKKWLITLCALLVTFWICDYVFEVFLVFAKAWDANNWFGIMYIADEAGQPLRFFTAFACPYLLFFFPPSRPATQRPKPVPRPPVVPSKTPPPANQAHTIDIETESELIDEPKEKDPTMLLWVLVHFLPGFIYSSNFYHLVESWGGLVDILMVAAVGLLLTVIYKKLKAHLEEQWVLPYALLTLLVLLFAVFWHNDLPATAYERTFLFAIYLGLIFASDIVMICDVTEVQIEKSYAKLLGGATVGLVPVLIGYLLGGEWRAVMFQVAFELILMPFARFFISATRGVPARSEIILEFFKWV